MADPPKTAPEATTGDKIRAYDRHGEKITIDKTEIGKLYALGGRIATKDDVAKHAQEEAERAVQARYDALPTVNKIAGAVTTAAGALTGNPLLVGSDNAPPTVAAYGAGVRQGFTGGLHAGVTRQAIDAIGGKAKGDQFAAQVEQERAASPIAYGAGEVAGMVGGSVLGEAGAARALPTAGASAVGSAAERAVASRLAGLAGRGALGRATATAAEMGVRGAIEGGALGASSYVGEQLLQDQELAADKLFAAIGTGAVLGGAGGAVLGGAGSLAASGVRAGVDAMGGMARRGLARAMASAEEATTALANGGTLEGQVNTRLKNLSNEFALDALGATKTQARAALEHADPAAVADYVRRVAITPAAEGGGVLGGSMKAAMSGRADDMLAAIQADKYGRIATGLSGSIKGTPARVNMMELVGHAEDIYAAMRKDPTKVAGAEAFLNRVRLEAGAVMESGKVVDGTIDAAEAFYLRSDMAKQAYELGKASGAAGDAYKTYLREWDRASIRALDEAAEKGGKSGLGDEIRHWKREWQLASAAEEMAEGGAERMTRNNTFGIRESIGAAVGLATGNPLGAAGTMLGGKLLRERGSAFAAHALSEIADRGLLAKWVQRVDDQIGKASKGLLQPPAKGLLKPADKMPASKALARAAIDRAAQFQADPEGYVEKATRQAEALGAAHPEIAQAIVQRQVQAAAFLAEKIPHMPDPDPLDPHPAPKMTASEQAELARYAWYVEKPERFFKEVSRGKVTYEGAETAQRLMPRAFAELQERTMEALATQMAKGAKIPYRQRLVLGTLLDVAATPSQRPDHGAFLQQNVASVLPSEQPPAAPARSRPVSIPTQRSALDRLEANGPGRR